MDSRIELNNTTTYRFFKTWWRKIHQDKKQELLDAVKLFRNRAIFCPFRRLVEDEFDFNVFKPMFDELQPLERYELIKNTLLIGDKWQRFYGMCGNDFLLAIKANLSEIITHFSQEQRIELARIDMERSGIAILADYQLPEDVRNMLSQQAQERARATLPSLSEGFVKECIRSPNPEALQYHLARQFSGPLFSAGLELRAELEAKLHEWSAEALLEVIYRAKNEQEQMLLRNGWFQYPRFSDARPHHWGKHKSITGETLVPFTHGGGFYHILDYLTGHSEGYRLECSGKGIQVSPDIHREVRDVFYAERACAHHFDYPARLSGTIKAKYLDKAVNDYEAGLRPEFIGFITDIVITRLDRPGITYTIGTIDKKEALPRITKPGEMMPETSASDHDTIPTFK